MQGDNQKSVICQICKKPKRMSEVVPAELVSEPVVEIIRKTYPNWSNNGFICIPDLNDFRAKYVKELIESEKGEFSDPEKQVVKSIREEEILAKNVNLEFEKGLTLGQRLADGLSDFAGSWRFIIGFVIVLIIWISVNVVVLVSNAFDPYPFILLNLVLSCLAAMQAPIILMSQNRQEQKDRLRAEADYRTNLKAELEIRHLHEKLNHLIRNQWQRLLEIQEVQTELMEELSRRQDNKK
jgi:uncharacterized membrane protein